MSTEAGQLHGIDVTSEPPASGSLQLRSGEDGLTLLRADEDLRVRLASRSRGDAFTLALDGDDFDAETAARRIASAFISQLSLTHGGSYVPR